jgi:hypothetical protein
MIKAVFFVTKSKRTDTLDLKVSNYGLSFEIFKSKIEDLILAALVGAVAHARFIKSERS